MQDSDPAMINACMDGAEFEGDLCVAFSFLLIDAVGWQIPKIIERPSNSIWQMLLDGQSESLQCILSMTHSECTGGERTECLGYRRRPIK